ncbi:hypothetical protein PHJA_001436400 [Phtheirospermum japonicum]|uniref:SWIM-type domain-containing protein n=1 Tax=Phtheirospermum japonicum TaxID=374723 RepID=A0A830CF18_9LAMI|nr:hypothetical protein PHJA_001436400 [Phtheirospermum japonicum]
MEHPSVVHYPIKKCLSFAPSLKLSEFVPDPPGEDFCSADLDWVKFGSAERCDDVALIPYDRVDAFIIGECSKAESPTRFHIEWGRKRARGSLKEYWCSFGPENYGEGGSILPSRRYRLNTRNRAARPQSMWGCTCHFVVKCLYARPSLALLIYNERRHVNKAGFVCHGPLDKDAIGPGAKKVPYVCSEIKQQTMSMIYLGIPEENVLEKHIEGIQRYGDSDARAKSLASQYVQKLGMIIKLSSHELDLDDQASIGLWTEWQLQQMIRFGHRNIIAANSTFGIKRLKYPLCTLLVFDSRQHALPVAWIITRSIVKPDVVDWMKALLDRVHSVDPGWNVNGFLIDDAAAEIDPLRQNVLPVSWLKHIVKKCANVEVQREIFKRLGQIVYGIWGGMDLAVALEEFSIDFVDQTSFMQYFKDSWMPKLEMWLTSMKTLPLASQEASGAIEAYHVKLKTKLYDDDSHLGSHERVDWLIHKLTTELHSSYWLDRYADEGDSGLQIPDDSVSFDDKNRLFAQVVSQKDGSLKRVVWNPGSEFAHCDCEWSLQGNLCKHIVKVNMICENLQSYQSPMSFQSLKNILIDLWKKPGDDSVALDISTAWTYQMLDDSESGSTEYFSRYWPCCEQYATEMGCQESQNIVCQAVVKPSCYYSLCLQERLK